jgi:Domain of unknown function (DUF4062)
MRVFISSVRRGLEEERDALPGLIRAIGHAPVRFEDYTAQSVPSRQACLQGVDSSDVYVLLLGPNYGYRFDDTGQSPTHDEWVAATTRGLPRIVFRKSGVEFEPEQEEFAKQIGGYTSGVFYDTFANAADLLTKVAAKLRELEVTPPALTFEPLPGSVTVSWRSEFAPSSSAVEETFLEVHVVPMDGLRRSARVMSLLTDQLVTGLRSAGAIPPASAVVPTQSKKAIMVDVPAERHGFREVRLGQLRGVRVAADGQASLWWSLPGDGLGTLLDANQLPASVAAGLRLIGALRLLDGTRFAVAIGLTSMSMVSEGVVTGVARSSASLAHWDSGPLHVDPDESVSLAAFDRGADEVATALVTMLLAAFRS